MAHLEDRTVEFTRKVLEAIPFTMRQVFERTSLEFTKVSINEMVAGFSNDLVVNFETKILGQKFNHKYQVKVKIPKNWFWHLLKNIGFKKYKEQTVIREIDFNCFELFPKANVHVPIGQPVYYVEQCNFDGVMKIGEY